MSINAVTGARTASAGLTLMPADVGQRGRFAGAGTPGRQVIMSLTPPTDLTNPAGDTIAVLAMNLDGPTTRTIAADHSFFVGVGGVIFIAANQAEGLYSRDLRPDCRLPVAQPRLKRSEGEWLPQRPT